MKISIQVPDDIAQQLGGHETDLSRRALEALMVASYREGLVTSRQVQRILGLRSRLETEAFLHRSGAFLAYGEEDLEADLQALDEIA